ncbi:unnamed protein product [Brugia timori]|uniref:Uncharacterized protein n=1 Tax=Brugia timori TaxID=42155 RepID=A0A3P7WLM5_9BILA|nr:unnamed protein product [Brugia timori]
MRHHVRRRQHGGHDEGHDDEVAAEGAQLLDGHHLETHQQHHDDRHLEGDAEGEVQRQDGLDVRGDVGRGRDRGRRELLDEAEHLVEHEQLHEGDARIGQQAAEDDQRQREALLVGVEAGRHEHPGLVHEPWQREQYGGHHQYLERHEEGRKHAHGDQLGVGRHVGTDRHRDDVDQPPRAGPDRQQDAGDRHAVDAIEQPVAQLHQVRDERLLGAGELVFFVLGVGISH